MFISKVFLWNISFILLSVIVFAADGQLTISSSLPVNFANQKIVKIQKGDNFQYTNISYPDQDWPVVSLPSSWDPAVFPGYQGICWYRLHIRFPGVLAEKAYGISLGEIYLADEAYFNGHLIGRTGKFNNLTVTRHYQDRIYEIPTQHILRGQDNVVSIRVKGFIPGECGPLSGNFNVDYYSRLLSRFFLKEFIKLVFSLIYFIMGVYFLIFFFRRPSERDFLYFGLFNLNFALYNFLRNDLRYFLSDFAYLQMEYSTLYILFPLFMTFILKYFKRKLGLIHHVIYASTIICILIIYLTDSPLIWKHLNMYYAQFSWLIPIGVVFSVLLREFKKSLDARLMTFGFIIHIFFVVHDVLFNRTLLSDEFTAQYGFMSNYFFLVFIIFISIIISDKYHRLTKQIEAMNIDLKENYRKISDINIELERQVDERTKALNQANTELTKKQTIIKEELAVAKRVQMTLVPMKDRLPKNPGFELSSTYSPMEDLGGDLYDIIRIDEDSYAFLVTDVSGHGAPSALITTMIKASYNYHMRAGVETAQITREINEEMVGLIGDLEQYFTAFLGILNLKENTFSYTNAGHPPALLYKGKEKRVEALHTQGMLIGVFSGRNYGQGSVRLEAGDGVVLFTDGIIEALNEENRLYGTENFRKFIFENGWRSSEEFIRKFEKEIEQYCGKRLSNDDRTVLYLKIK